MRQRICALVAPGQVGPHARLEADAFARCDRLVDCVCAAVGELGDRLFGGGIDDRDHLAGAGSAAELVEDCLQLTGCSLSFRRRSLWVRSPR